MKINLAENLKKIRKENNLSQEQLAEKLGVSRQSVSKWEAGQAYPEMDKVLQICKLFNLNMDELFNQDVKEINEVKESKANVNKYIDDFLDFITKTIDMFTSLRFREKVKCLFEQVLLTCIFGVVFLFIGAVLINFVRGILRFLPEDVFYGIINVFEDAYLIVALFLGAALLLHIFKTRYLDYYEIIKEKPEDNGINRETEKNDASTEANVESDKKEKHKIFLEKKKERIVIRDPKHSGYKFISGLLRCFLFLMKAIVFCVGLFFSFTLVGLIAATVISFAFVKTGFLFVGALAILLAAIAVNLIILYSNYNFLMSRKGKKGRSAIAFLISLILAGLGIAFIVFGISKLEFVDNLENDEYFISTSETLEMTESTSFEFYWHNGIEYVPTENEDIRVEFRHSNCYDVNLVKFDEESDSYQIQLSVKESEFDLYKRVLEDIKNLQIVDYSQTKVTIYTAEENIEKLKRNAQKRNEEEHNISIQNMINDYEQRISELEKALSEAQNQLY